MIRPLAPARTRQRRNKSPALLMCCRSSLCLAEGWEGVWRHAGPGGAGRGLGWDMGKLFAFLHVFQAVGRAEG